MDEAQELCDKILNDRRFDDAELKKQVNELKAAILYEKNEFNQAIECLNPDDKKQKDIQCLMNEGCIYFKIEQHEKAIGLFKEASKLCGFNAELYYNIALCYYEMGTFSEAYFYLDTIIRRAYELYPKLKLVSPENPVFEKNDKLIAQ